MTIVGTIESLVVSHDLQLRQAGWRSPSFSWARRPGNENGFHFSVPLRLKNQRHKTAARLPSITEYNGRSVESTLNNPEYKRSYTEWNREEFDFVIPVWNLISLFRFSMYRVVNYETVITIRWNIRGAIRYSIYNQAEL